MDNLYSLCRYYSLEYLVDCTTLIHREKNNGGCVFILSFKIHDLWAECCADLVKELIELAETQLFNNSEPLRDYIWFFKQKPEDKSIHVAIIFFGNGEVFANLDMAIESFDEVLTDFEIDIPTLKPEQAKPLIMRHIDISDGSLLLDCGFASNFKFSGNMDK